MTQRDGRMSRATLLGGALGLTLSALAGQAAAQSLQLPEAGVGSINSGAPIGLRLPAPEEVETPERRGPARGTTVLARPREGFDPVPIRAGSFNVLPEINGSIGYDSNVTGGVNGDSDVVATIGGRATLRSDWSLHALNFSAQADQRFYFDHSDASEFTYDLNANGRYDLTRGHSISGGLLTQRVAQSRVSVSEFGATQEPTMHETFGGNLGTSNRFGRFRTNLSGSYVDYDYKDSVTLGGLPIDNSYRDYALTEFLLGGGYEVSAGREVFASLNFSQRRYDDAASAAFRDSDGYELLVGLASEITPLIRGRIGLGYIEQDFKDPTVEDVDGIAVDIDVSYLATELLTLKVNARRYLENIALPSSTGSMTTSIGVGADFEYRRNVILSGGVEYADGDYVNSPGGAEVLSAYATARYFVNRHYMVAAQLEARTRSFNRLGVIGESDDVVGVIRFVYRP